MNKVNVLGRGVNLIKRALFGVAVVLCSVSAQAGTESQKLINVLNVTDNGTFIAVVSPSVATSECGAFGIIGLVKDANYDARFAVLLAAKLSGTPVTLIFSSNNGVCAITQVQVQ